MIKVTAYTNPETIVINSLRDLAATTTEDGVEGRAKVPG